MVTKEVLVLLLTGTSHQTFFRVGRWPNGSFSCSLQCCTRYSCHAHLARVADPGASGTMNALVNVVWPPVFGQQHATTTFDTSKFAIEMAASAALQHKDCSIDMCTCALNQLCQPAAASGGSSSTKRSKMSIRCRRSALGKVLLLLVLAWTPNPMMEPPTTLCCSCMSGTVPPVAATSALLSLIESGSKPASDVSAVARTTARLNWCL
jgi:hypothetical protein